MLGLCIESGRLEATYTTGGQVTGHPLPVSIALLLEAEELLELITESEVQGLGGEVTNDVGSVATPQGHDTLIGSGAAEAVHNAGVAAVETASLDHLILFQSLAWFASVAQLG